MRNSVKFAVFETQYDPRIMNVVIEAIDVTTSEFDLPESKFDAGSGN